MRRFALAALATPISSAAIAHAGNHELLSFAELGAHVLERDHLLLLLAASTVVTIAYRAKRRAEARVTVRKERRHDPR